MLKKVKEFIDHIKAKIKTCVSFPLQRWVLPDAEKNAAKARYEFACWSNKHMIPSKICTIDLAKECPTLVKLLKM